MENKEITLADYVVDKLASEVKELKVRLAQTEFTAMAYKEKYESLLKEQEQEAEEDEKTVSE